MSRATVIHIQPRGVEIPIGIDDLDRFRRWTHSESFPLEGRIDWLAGRVEVDLSPEDISTHATPKVAFTRGISPWIEDADRGFVVTDRTRYSSRDADLSCEPDVMAILFESIESGRVRLVPKADGTEGRHVEVEGAADLVVEIVSDSSEDKDTKRLRKRYFRAGVPEYWLPDLRGSAVRFTILGRGPRAFVESTCRGGWAHSPILAREVRLLRLPRRAGVDRYRLETREPAARKR